MRLESPATPFAASYRFGPAAIRFETDDQHAAQWLDEFLLPWFEPLGPTDAKPLVRLVHSEERYGGLGERRRRATIRSLACFALDTRVVALPAWDERATTVIADDGREAFYVVHEDGCTIVTRPGNRRARLGAMRVVREFAAVLTRAETPCAEVHAAAVEVGGLGVAVAGPKRAGKTTLLTHLLATGEARMVANDRAFVTRRENGYAIAGMPTVLSVRDGTRALLPHSLGDLPDADTVSHLTLEELERGASHPSQRSPEAMRIRLSPAYYLRLLGAEATGAVPLAVVLFPRITPEIETWELEPLSAVDTVACLRAARFGEGSAASRRTVFEGLLGVPVREREDDPSLERLAGDVVSFRCRLGPRAYAVEGLLDDVLAVAAKTGLRR